MEGWELDEQIAKRGVKKGDLAMILGVPNSYVSEMIGGRRRISVEGRELYPGQKEAESGPWDALLLDPSREQEIREVLWEWTDEEIADSATRAWHQAMKDSKWNAWVEEQSPELRAEVDARMRRTYRLGDAPPKVPLKRKTDEERERDERLKAEEDARKAGGPVTVRYVDPQPPTD